MWLSTLAVLRARETLTQCQRSNPGASPTNAGTRSRPPKTHAVARVWPSMITSGDVTSDRARISSGY